MEPSSLKLSPLRQRMIDDMRMRKLEVKTGTSYLRAVKKLAVFLGRSPDTATVEDLRSFQLYLVDQGTSPITLNATRVRPRQAAGLQLQTPGGSARRAGRAGCRRPRRTWWST